MSKLLTKSVKSALFRAFLLDAKSRGGWLAIDWQAASDARFSRRQSLWIIRFGSHYGGRLSTNLMPHTGADLDSLNGEEGGVDGRPAIKKNFNNYVR